MRIALCNSLLSPLAALSLCCVAAIPVPTRAAENLLVNPGFEAGPTGATVAIPGWTPYLSYAVDSTNALVYQSTANVPVHGGTNTFKTWGGFQSYDTYSGAYQDVPAAPDSTWFAEAWVLTHPDDRMAGDNTCWLEVSFRSNTDPNNPLITYLSEPVTATSPAGEWIHLVVGDGLGGQDLVAPFGTSFVRCQIVYRQLGNTYAGGSAYVDDVVLRKTSAPDPEITVHPVNQTRVYGQSASLTVTATGRSALTYQWQKNGGDLTDGGGISGATTSNLVITAVQSLDEGFYTVLVKNNAGQLVCDPAVLSVLDPGIIAQPQDVTRAIGDSVSLSVQAAASTALTYQWYRNGNALNDGANVSGARASTLTLSNLGPGDAGDYVVSVNTSLGSVTSEPATLRVKSAADLANRLENPGFEEGMAFWTPFNGNGLEDTNTLVFNSLTTYAPTHGGTNVNKSYGAGVWNGVFQDRSVSAGQAYTADLWFRTEAEDLIAAPNSAWLEVQFLNAGGGLLGLYKSELITPDTAASTWHQLAATNIIAFWGDYSVVGNTNALVVPEGVTTLRFQVTFHAPGGGAGSVYADDARLLLVEPLVLEIQLQGDQVQLAFTTQPGAVYQVQFKNALTDANWQILTTVQGDGGGKSVTDPLRDAAFYRVQQQ